MKKSISLLAIPVLLLSSCGGQVVEYSEYITRAREAVNNGYNVKVEQMILESKLKASSEGITYNFYAYEVYYLVGNQLVVDKKSSKYEGINESEYTAFTSAVSALRSVKASDVKERVGTTYTINPFSVYNETISYQFDDKGNVTNCSSKEIGSEIYIKISYKYQ